MVRLIGNQCLEATREGAPLLGQAPVRPIVMGAFRVCPGNLKFFILIFNVIFEYLNEGFILNRAAESQHLIAVF